MKKRMQRLNNTFTNSGHPWRDVNERAVNDHERKHSRIFKTMRRQRNVLIIDSAKDFVPMFSET
jgi:hypothetical protein